MGELEDEIKQIVLEEALKNPKAKAAWDRKELADVEFPEVVALIADKLDGVEQAVYRLAREIDESRP
jgi:hypothetical protein